MRRTAILAATALIALATSGSAIAQRLPKQSGPSPLDRQLQGTASDPAIAAARRITREEAIKLVREGKAVYVDVRSKASYDKGHIKGALSFPNSQLMTRIKELPPGKLVITYCACVKEHTAAVAVVNLSKVGFRNAAALVGGWDEWVELGLPTEKSKS